MAKKDKSSSSGNVQGAEQGSDAFGDSEMSRRVVAFDWGATSLGTPEVWPQHLRAVVNLVLRSSVPMLLLWGKDGVMIYNDALATLAGSKHPKILGARLREGWPEIADLAGYAIGQVLSGKLPNYKDRPLTFEGQGKTENIWTDFDYTPVTDEENKPVGVLSIVTETSGRVCAERKRAEEALEAEREYLRELLEQQIEARERVEASEARFRYMAESLPQHIWTATPDGKIDYVNQHTLDYFQKPSEAFFKEGWQSALHPDDLQGTLEARAHSLKEGGIFEKEFRLKRSSDDTYRWHLSRALPVYDEQHNIVKWIGSNTDIQEIKSATRRRDELERIADALREQRTELIALNQSKDEFISLASHQLRTPATGVKQYIGMLLEGFVGNPTDEQRQFLTNAYESNERQLAIVNDLLKVASVDSRKVKLHYTSVSLVPLIGEIVDEQASEFALKRQTVSFRHRGSDYMAWGDKDLLRMVLENLIDNARKYTYEGKTITITLTKPRGVVRIDIHDEGVGIAAEDIEKLGQKFIRLENPLSTHVGGTGLGLYWAQRVIDLHEGKLIIGSVEGQGSTFSIVLKQPRKG